MADHYTGFPGVHGPSGIAEYGNPQQSAQDVPGLKVWQTLSGLLCEVRSLPLPMERRIPIVRGGQVRIHYGKDRIALDSYLELGPPEDNGKTLSFLNLTSGAVYVKAVGPEVPVMSLSGTVAHRFNGRFGEITMIGLGSSFELFSDGGEWVITAEHDIQKIAAS